MAEAGRFRSGARYCHAQVAAAIRDGKLKHPARDGLTCADCGGPARDYDHRDYNAPLTVDAVCRPCNLRRGSAVPRTIGERAATTVSTTSSDLSPTAAALRRAVNAAGGQSALARVVGGKVKQAHVWNWLNAPGAKVPAEFCITIEAATRVSRHDLRPDVFGPAPAVASKASA